MALRFLSADAPLAGAQAMVQGLPWDGGSSFRSGSAAGPEAIRLMSDSLWSYSPVSGRDLDDLRLHDAGDLDLEELDAAAVMQRIAERTERLSATGSFLMSFGGDHSVSIGTARGLRRVHPNLAHLVLDAHLDLSPEYEGSEYSHTCGTWHMSAGGPTVVLGARSGSRQEWERAGERLAGLSRSLDLPPGAASVLTDRPVHVSIDLDVLDPSVMPGVANPEPGGPSYPQIRDALLGLAGIHVVAVDLVELCPPADPSGISAVTAAALARDVICALVGAR